MHWMQAWQALYQRTPVGARVVVLSRCLRKILLVSPSLDRHETDRKARNQAHDGLPRVVNICHYSDGQTQRHPMGTALRTCRTIIPIRRLA
jgi:hypothetical protein